MATHSDPTPVPGAAPSTPAADTRIDTGVYAWFRRHQKVLLYTAGLFTLLTFSITGPMIALVEGVFARSSPLPTIQVGAERVAMTTEDYQYGEQLARNASAFALVLPRLGVGDGGSSELGDVMAILRRAAIAEGIDVSMAEVDRAIDTLLGQSGAQSAAQLAVLQGMSSLQQYRALMREAMRIGTLVRLSTLALDTSDAKVLAKVLEDKEKITLRVATFDEKALEEELKQKGGLTDEDLRKWLDGKSQSEKMMLQVFDSNRVALRIGAALLAEFDPAQWQDEALKDFTVGEELLQKTYDQEKATRFKTEKEGEWKPLTDEAVKNEVTKLLQAEQVMNFLRGKLVERLNDWMKEANEALRRASDEFFTRQNAVTVAKQKIAEKPDDEAAKEELRLAEEVMPAMENARKESEEAVKQRRATFDFNQAFTELTTGKAGFVLREFTDKRGGEELKDLERDGLGLGEWPVPQAHYLRDRGALANMPGRTSKAVILYQVGDIEVQPLKPWDKLKPLLEGAWYTEQAKQQAEAKKKAIEEALMRLAKAKMPEKIAELEGRRAGDLDKQLADWEQKLVADIEAAKLTLAKATPGTQSHKAYEAKLQRLEAELARKEEKRAEFDVAVGKAIEADIQKEAKKFYGEVLAAAAAEAGFTVAEHGPYARELSQRPRFDKLYDPTVVYLWQNHQKLEVGEATDVVQDATNRRYHVAACIAEAPLTVDDVTRREFEILRTGYGFASFADQQAYAAYQQAFTKEALEKRYSYHSPVGTQEEMPPK